MYTKLTFTNSAVLTASNCNQLEENILETRVTNIGSGPPSSLELLAGNLWTKTSSDEWILNILNNSLQWMPFGVVDTASSIPHMHTQQVCTDTDGGPYVSSQALVLTSMASYSSFFKIGPSNNGSYDIVWPPLSEIPRTVDWIMLRTQLTYTTTGNDASISLLVKSWTYNGSRGAAGNDVIIASVGQQTLSVNSFKVGSHISTARIQVNSDNAFELNWVGNPAIGSGSAFLIGYGYNR